MKEYWGEDEYPIHSKHAHQGVPPYHVQRRAYWIFCTIYAAGLYGIVLTFNWPYIWEFLACIGTAILYAWAVNAKLKPLLNSKHV